jgi:ribose transport system substrate-binding protein
LNLIKDGSVDSAISQKPYTMGYVGLKALDEVHHNKPAKGFRNNYAVDPFAPFPYFIDTGTALIDKVNVDQYLGASQAVQQ